MTRLLGIGPMKPQMEVVMIGLVDKKYYSRPTETIRDRAFIFKGWDLAEARLRYFTEGYSRNFYNAVNANRGGDMSTVAAEIVRALQTDVQIGQIDNSGYLFESVTIPKNTSGFKYILGFAKKYKMKLMCRHGKVYLTRTLAGLDSFSSEVKTRPRLDYSNALLRFGHVHSSEPISVKKARSIAGEKAIDPETEEGKLVDEYYHFSCIGIPQITIGTSLDLVGKQDKPDGTRIDALPVRVTVVELSILYENRINGFTMQGIGVVDNPNQEIQRIRELGETPDSMAEAVQKNIEDTNQSTMAAPAKIQSSGRAQKATIAGSKPVDSGGQEHIAAATYDTEDLYYNVAQLLPFCGPKSGMIVPQYKDQLCVSVPLRGVTNQHIMLGQYWKSVDDVPAGGDSPANFAIQMGANTPDTKFCRFEMFPNGKIGMRATGIRITINKQLTGGINAVCEEAPEGNFEIVLPSDGTIKLGGTATLGVARDTDTVKSDSLTDPAFEIWRTAFNIWALTVTPPLPSPFPATRTGKINSASAKVKSE